MPKNDSMFLTQKQREATLKDLSGEYKAKLIEHADWKKKDGVREVLYQDEVFKQECKDLLKEMDKVANADIDTTPDLGLEN